MKAMCNVWFNEHTICQKNTSKVFFENHLNRDFIVRSIALYWGPI